MEPDLKNENSLYNVTVFGCSELTGTHAAAAAAEASRKFAAKMAELAAVAPELSGLLEELTEVRRPPRCKTSHDDVAVCA